MITKCDMCGKEIKEVGRLSHVSILIVNIKTKFGNERLIFKKQKLCKICIQKEKEKDKPIMNQRTEKNVNGNRP